MNPLNTWTLGVLIGLPIAAVIIIVSLVCVMLGLRAYYRDTTGYGDGSLLAWCGAIVGALTLLITAAALFPYEVQYHQFRDVSGIVRDIGHRQIADGKGMSERYVFVIDGAKYGVDDTRASLVKIGDRVELSCIKTWEWAATPGDVCRWIA